MQHCSLRGCIHPLVPAYAVFDFQDNQDELNVPKGNKNNLHYDDVRESFLRPTCAMMYLDTFFYGRHTAQNQLQ